MSLENAIKHFCSHNTSHREQHEKAGTADITECSHCSPCSHLHVDREKEARLREIIEQVSKNYGGDEADFFAEYTDNIIKQRSHDLNFSFSCFLDFANNGAFVIKKK